MVKPIIRSRNDFALFLRGHKLNKNAAEVGVAEGYFSFHLLDNWPGTLYLIDPWKVLNEPGYSVHGEHDQDDRYQRILDKAATYGERAQVRRMTSAKAAPVFDNDFFDFVYIDANHMYESVMSDLKLWWIKVRRGGLLAGHDYLQGVFDGVDYGVKKAVDLFAISVRQPVGVTMEESYPSWWIQKP